jgi:hypothetical protein
VSSPKSKEKKETTRQEGELFSAPQAGSHEEASTKIDATNAHFLPQISPKEQQKQKQKQKLAHSPSEHARPREREGQAKRKEEKKIGKRKKCAHWESIPRANAVL